MNTVQEDEAVQHHLANVSDEFGVEEEAEISRPLPSGEHGSPVPESPRSVYYDAEEDAFSITDALPFEVSLPDNFRRPDCVKNLSISLSGRAPCMGPEHNAPGRG